MKKKIFEQTCICLLIVFAIFISKNSNITVLEKGADAVMTYMQTSYTLHDAKKAAEKGTEMVASIPGKISGAVAAMSGKTALIEPIDEEYDENNQASVYAVAGGEVTAVGENEEIGKYIKITHGNVGESLYGNLQAVYIRVPSRVKKGQIIASYEKKEGKDFYYSFKEFNR